MQKVTLTACCILFTAFLYAQQVFFVYMQSEGRQPFYAKLNGRVHSSTAAGYLVIPRLVPGDYTLQVGFPKSEQSELNFPCRVESNDLGFSLKNFGDKGWGLFNLRNFSIIMPATAGAAKQGQNNQYSDLLAQVVKDPSVKDVKVEKTASVPAPDTPLKKEPPPAVKPVDTPAVPVKVIPEKQPVETVTRTDTPRVEPPLKTAVPEPGKPAEPSVQNQVTRIFSMGGKEGTEAIYVVTTGVTSDTIRIFIPDLKSPVAPQPVQTSELPKQEPPAPVKEPVILKQAPPTVVKEAAVEKTEPEKNNAENKFLNFEANKPKPADTSAIAAPVTDTSAKKPSKLIMYNTGCAKIAGEDDFIKLRKAMAGERTDEDMVAAARKAFKQRCYLLKHIKAVAGLIASDEGRYQLFDAAYAYTYDTEDYSTLGALLTDSYYINRFKAMIRK